MTLSNGLSGGGGHGGSGGVGRYNGTYAEGGVSYGSVEMPCELGSGSGDDSISSSTAGGGIVGKLRWPHCPKSYFAAFVNAFYSSL